MKFLLWRAWTTGTDRDYQIFQDKTRSRIARCGHGAAFAFKKTRRSWSRILFQGSKVDLPLWQRPAAMMIGLGYFLIAGVAEVGSALTRDYAPLPPRPSEKPRTLGSAV